MAEFHHRCGIPVSLSNNNRTANRNNSIFNHGIAISNEPLFDNELFEIKIDRKIHSWSGSLEIGVTACDPGTVVFPAVASELRGGSWILAGHSVIKNGRSIVDDYSIDLDKIDEGDRVGVLKTSEGELIFYVNGVSHGVAATGIPTQVYAVVDLNGKVVQVTITSASSLPETTPPPVSLCGEIVTAAVEEEGTGVQSTVTDLVASLDVDMTVQNGGNLPTERLRFHQRTGSLVKLSYNARTAERMRPLDEFNNGVVMTHRPLQDNQLFEIRIDRLVEKWSGSIEVGVTTHNPSALEFPATMTNMRSGTTMMSGCGILTNGKGTRREYGEFNLDELRVGDRIGMMRKANGNLHYFINGLDQGIAARVPPVVWGVVDLYGMTVKVTIVDRDEREEQNLITRRNTALRDQQITQSLNDLPDEDVVDRLMFHTNCGTHAAVINNARTAHRPNAMDDFNNGVVLTHRPLKPNELFEIRLDKMVTKWAGSIEIGVTTHSPTELEYPSTMTNVRSGTWMMTGNGVMHNGTTVIDEYGQNLDRLQVGDRVGVVLKESGSLHFLVNGIDQGEAATNIPPRVYGVIDLYGQAAQATILDYNCQCCCSPSTDTIHDSFPSHTSARPHSHADLHFHHVHGRNARVSNGGRTASRPRALAEFNDAIVMSNRSLRDDEMFAVVIEKIVDRWSGSIEAGVTAIRPDELELPGTMTDLDHDTWMLSGSAVMRDGVTLRHGYALDLDSVSTGAVVGMKRHRDGSLHYYLDGIDQGEACSGLPTNVYPVIDLYGQCAQVSIVSPVERQVEPESNENSCSQGLVSRIDEPAAITVSTTVNQPSINLILHRLSPWCGKNMTIQPTNVAAVRTIGQHNNGLVLSATPLTTNELFEVAVDKWSGQWASSLAIGVTLGTPADKNPLPPTIAGFKADTWFIQGNEVFHNGRLLRSHYCRSLDWLRVGDRVGVRRCNDGTLHFYINGCDQGAAAQNIPKRVFAVVDCYGSVSGIRVTSKLLAHPLTESQVGDGAVAVTVAGAVALNDEQQVATVEDETSTSKRWVDGGVWNELTRSEDIIERRKQNSLDVDLIDDGDLEMEDGQGECTDFHEVHGRNVQLSDNRMIAKRIASYNQGLILSRRYLPKGYLFQIRIESLNPRWVSSLCIGVTTHIPGNSPLPVTALGLKRDTWIICGDFVFHNGHKVKYKYGPNLDTLGIGHTIGIMIDNENQLKLFIDDVDQGIAAADISVPCRVVVDLYGQCEQVSVIKPYNEIVLLPTPVDLSSTVRKEVEIENTVDTRNSSEETEVINEVADYTAQEKADLESHEKESPTGSECDSVSGTSTSIREDPMRAKSDKTNENIQVEMLMSASSILSSGGGGIERGVESDEEEYELDPKSIASNENLTLQQFEQQQNAEISRHIAETNCDHKTGLNLANTSFVKSPSSSAIKPIVSRSLENSLASSLPTPLISPSATVKTNLDCEYLNSCMRLKTALGLPGAFFNMASAICYCQLCWSPSKITDLPLNSVPFGWLRLPLRRRNFDAAMAGSATDQWHTAFFGTSLGTVRKILDLGELFTPGELGLGQNVHRKLHSKQDDCDATQLVLSPSIQYIINSKHPYVDPKTQKQMVAYAAFQVLVRPGSYKIVAPVTVTTPPAQFDLNSTSVDATEWVTKERNATVITALLLKLVPT